MKYFKNAVKVAVSIAVIFITGGFSETADIHSFTNIKAGSDSTMPIRFTKASSASDNFRLYAIEGGKLSEHSFLVKDMAARRTVLKGSLGLSHGGRIIEAWYFPGTSGKRAMVIGGMHGSELSSITVARSLIQLLSSGRQPYYNVIVIPSLFPDNAAFAAAHPLQVGSLENVGRYTSAAKADPNRQMPEMGKSFDVFDPVDHFGRAIERENQLMLQLISAFRPQRIVNIHAIRETGRAGVYADPRTDAEGLALGFSSDSSLAVEMAKHVKTRGGNAPGNISANGFSAVYYKDPQPAGKGVFQKRTIKGSKLSGNRGYGISLGTWASTAVDDSRNPTGNRPAIRLLTMEFPGYRPPELYQGAKRKIAGRQVAAYASSIAGVFLNKCFAEEEK